MTKPLFLTRSKNHPESFVIYLSINPIRVEPRIVAKVYLATNNGALAVLGLLWALTDACDAKSIHVCSDDARLEAAIDKVYRTIIRPKRYGPVKAINNYESIALNALQSLLRLAFIETEKEKAKNDPTDSLLVEGTANSNEVSPAPET